MKPYFYDMMVAVGMTDPRWIQLADQEYGTDKSILQSSKAMREALAKLTEENPKLKLLDRSPAELLPLMRAHYERYTWMEKHGCFYLSPEQPGYPDIMYRMDRTTGSKTGRFYPGVIYCKGNRKLLTQRLHILAGSNKPYGFEVKDAIAAIVRTMKAESCHPIIPLSTAASWDLIQQCIEQELPPVIILDKGMDSYLENSDETERVLIEQALQVGGLLMTNRRVGESHPLLFPNQYKLYFMYAFATRMHIVQVSPSDNSHFLMEAAMRHHVRISLLNQKRLPPPLPDYYRQLPSLVELNPFNDWLHL